MDIIRAQEQSRDLHESFHNQVIAVIDYNMRTKGSN